MMTKIPVGPGLAPALCTLIAAACTTISEPEDEIQLRSMIAGDTAPEWVTGRIPTSPGTVAFVGRGGGFDVLDERHAYDEALGHARAQLAQYVSTQVTAEACERDVSIGTRYLPRDMREWGSPERVNQDIRSRAHEISDVVVGGVAANDQHWERWDVKNERRIEDSLGSRRTGLRRYKCWVLSVVDVDTINGYVESALRALGNEARFAETEASLARAVAQNAASARDLVEAEGVVNANLYELQRLRERVHYGRRFRLSGAEDCLHYRAPCDFSLLHPEWRAAEGLTRTDVVEFLPLETEEAADCCGLCDLGLHGG
ncbi:MAG: hypothetical protein CMJ84_02825 [Planctomycetes bacterium]|jgi:hypothetical protein|nr:hypothetical protein [Planctomycetota bacterium]MDP6408065.1 hypothetical protein [Planctomycetota bacterium]